ncbi:RNA polymerase sigma factor [Pedobacter fastidiosus]|uniref:RNA polymerase sigma-70 region 2 domain-containing protein n=1 Tax=Pedobacter fastidiosus TaxID=2765361 RepID=A0ABR7KWN5_9SPHI|nr:sigma factor [Pedobacter fastidiosus]MBC6112235.1 hypothetical protein [Pedobacter fastidiosus]
MQASLSNISLQEENQNPKAWVIGQEIFLQKLKMQDIQVFKSLYKQYSASLYGSIIRAVGDEKRANAILHETFLEAWDSLQTYQESQCKMFTWLSRIAKRKGNTA